MARISSISESAGVAEQAVDEGLELAVGHRAHETVDRLSPDEGVDGRHRLHPQLPGEHRVAVDIDLDELHRALGRFDRLFQSAGVSCRQGPHHVAQKSTITGWTFEASTTSATKVASEPSLMRSVAAPADVFSPISDMESPERLKCR